MTLRRARSVGLQTIDLVFLGCIWSSLLITGIFLLFYTLPERIDLPNIHAFTIPTAGILVTAVFRILQGILTQAINRIAAYDMIVADIAGIEQALRYFDIQAIERVLDIDTTTMQIEFQVRKFKEREEDYFIIFHNHMSTIAGLRPVTLKSITEFYSLFKASRDAALAVASWRCHHLRGELYQDIKRVFYLLAASLEQAQNVIQTDKDKLEELKELTMEYKRIGSRFGQASETFYDNFQSKSDKIY